MTRTSSLEVSIKTYIDCILYIDCSICFIIVHMVAFVNLILKKMMMMIKHYIHSNLLSIQTKRQSVAGTDTGMC